MRAVFMGTPEMAIPCLEQLLLSGYEVVGVYTQPDKPVGRRSALSPSPVKRAALAHNLPVFQPPSLRQPEAVAQLAELRPDVVVVTAYGQILPQAVLDIPRRGCINVHFSLLPRHRGASPVAAAILAGDEFTGVSIMLIERGLDTGPVLGRAAVGISPEDTTGTLTAKLSVVGSRFLVDVLGRWLRDEIQPQPQEAARASYSGPLSKESGEVDWGLPTLHIWRRVRAYQPWPGSYTRWQGRLLKIIEAVPVPARQACRVGEVMRLESAPRTGAGFGVCTGNGVLAVVAVQLEGKQAMSADDFVRGQRGFIGSVLPS